jgi:hypothetical protein
VPSVVTTKSGLPTAWIDPAADPSAATVTDEHAVESTTSRTHAEFGQTEAMVRRRRWWPFLGKYREPEFPDVTESPDIDLVALDADDEAWTDLTLAALEEPAADADASMPGIDGFDGFDGFDSVMAAGDGPWSALADELQERDAHQFAEPAPRGTDSTAHELETEFWA